MADLIKLQGSLTSEPFSGVAGCPGIDVAIKEQLTLKKTPHVTQVDLETDATEVVNFGDLAQAEVVYLKATGGKVSARLTSADGIDQSVPVDPLFVLFTSREPVTAIDLTRVAGSPTTVKVCVLLGEKA